MQFNLYITIKHPEGFAGFELERLVRQAIGRLLAHFVNNDKLSFGNAKAIAGVYSESVCGQHSFRVNQ